MSKFLILALFIPSFCPSLPANAQAKGGGSISGLVTIEDKPAPGISVKLHRRESRWDPEAEAEATTDAEGRFRLTGISPGAHILSASSPIYVAPGSEEGDFGKLVTVSAGEAIEDQDIKLVRGGVVTGRITDAAGRPLIEEFVMLVRVFPDGTKRPFMSPFSIQAGQTDDRGEYRYFGVPAGEYLVAVGAGSNDDSSLSFGWSRHQFQRTYYPNAVKESEAKTVTVTPGSEATDIDITPRNETVLFSASGRVVDESDKPVKNQYVLCGIVGKSGNIGGMMSSGDTKTNEKGEFQITGLSPGTYRLMVLFPGQTDLFAEPVPIEIKDSDLKNLVIPMQRGAVVSGVVQIEGSNDPKIRSQLVNCGVYAAPPGDFSGLPRGDSVKEDGSFRIEGVKPGKVRISFVSFDEGKFPFVPLRSEYNGAPIPSDGLDIEPRGKLNGVRIIVGYGTGKLSGRIEAKNGKLPEGVEFGVSMRRLGSPDNQNGRFVPVDSRGRFSAEGLLAGEYELTLNAVGRGPAPAVQPTVQKVVIAPAGETETVFVLDLETANSP